MVLHSPITRNHMHMRPAITPRMATLVRITMGARTGILGPAFVGIVVAGLCALVLLPGTDVKILGLCLPSQPGFRSPVGLLPGAG